MDEIGKKFDELAERYPDYESDVCDAINCIERATFTGVDKGKIQLEIAKKRLKEIDDLIASTLLLENLSNDVNDRLMQCFISFRPRLESHIEQLKNLIENPPKESIFPPIDDSEIYPKENEDKEETDQNNSTIQDENNSVIASNNENELIDQKASDEVNKANDNIINDDSRQPQETDLSIPLESTKNIQDNEENNQNN